MLTVCYRLLQAMCVFEHFLKFFIDLLFGCLHKQSTLIKMSFLQEWLLYTQLLEIDTFHPFLGIP